MGFDKKGSCRAFRTARATMMLEGGADLRFIQAMLGHADIQTTQIYARVSVGALAQVYENTHPSARTIWGRSHRASPTSPY
jgi:integrase/recombinase XerD